MSEDELGEIRDELKEYKKQLDALREDLRLLIRRCPPAQNDILSTANQGGNPGVAFLTDPIGDTVE
jgi:hypothetical protein